jgi:anti-sigma factor RsiW
MMLTMRATEPCPQFSERISLALDHQLSAEEERELHQHLRTCDACQAQWDTLQRIERLFTTAPLVSAPASFAARVSARLAGYESRRQIVFGVFSLMVGAFVLMSIALATVGGSVPSLYLLATTPAAWHGLTVIAEMVSLVESVLNALWLAIVAYIRSPGAMICVIYSFVVLMLTMLWLHVLTGRLLRPVPVSRRA